jgi:hypothetical protein
MEVTALSKATITKEFKGGSMARTFLIQKENDRVVRKVASMKDGLGAEKLMSQWRWLFEFDEKDLFPAVDFCVITKDLLYYDMEYIELDSFRDYIIKEDDLDGMILHDILIAGSKIATPILGSYDGGKSTYIKDKHLKKMVERCKGLAPYDFYKLDEIYINGKLYKNLHKLIEEIINDNELMELLKPKCWFRSHGDFTFQNILADEFEVKVIDPRGEGSDSIYYDISKLYQSCHGKYDLLYEGNYTAWTDGRTDTINYKIHNNVEKFNGVFKALRTLIPDYYELHDEHWELITKFFEASHFISMTPFRLKENGTITAICYAIGIQILNEVLEEWETIKNGTNTNFTRV